MDVCGCMVAGEDVSGERWSAVSIFKDVTADMRSATCWSASSRQTQGVFSLQKPQSKVSSDPPGSNRLVFPDVAISKMPLRPKFWGKRGASRPDGMGEKEECASESAEEIAEGDDA